MPQIRKSQQPSSRKTGNQFSLLQIYLLSASAVVVFFVLLILLLSLWQTRQRASLQLANQMTVLSLAWPPDSAEMSDLLTDFPPGPIASDHFVLDANNNLIARRHGNTTLNETWPPSNSRSLPLEPGTVGTTYSTRGRLSGDIFHIWQPPQTNPPIELVSIISAASMRNAALRSSILPTLSLILLLAVGAGTIKSVERYRTRQFQRLAEASLLVTQGNLATSIDVGGRSDLGKLGELFDTMRRSLKERIDNSALLLQVSQDVTDTRDLDHGMAIILRGLLQATNASGVRAVVLNPMANRPLRFGAGDSAEMMGVLDRQILDLVRNSTGDVVLRSPERVRKQFKLPDDQPPPIASLIAFPLYAVGRLHGLLWVGYDEAMLHEPTEIDLMRSYVSRAAALVANMRLYALAEGGYRRLAAVLQSTQEAVIVTDHTDRIVLANPAFGEAFGLDAKKIIGRNVNDILTNTDLISILSDPIEKVHRREISNNIGETFYTSTAKVTANDNQLAGRVAVFHNITRMKQLEEMKSNFVRNVSHDLRNPLAYMHTYASMLPEVGTLTSKQQDYVDNIINGIQRMHDTIGAVLDLNRIESASDDLLIETIDTRLLLHELALEHQSAAESHGSELVVQAEPNITLEADRWALKLALNNLLTNALKYASSSSEITLGAERKRVGKEAHESIVFFVRDQGSGIGKADQLRIFEKYYRAAEPAVSKVEGSGLGLAIVKSIAERHAGHAWVQSERDRGSTFFLALPIDTVFDTPKQALSAD